MTKFMNSSIVETAKTIRRSIKNGEGLPKTVVMEDSAGKNHEIAKRYYNGLFESRNVFLLKNGRVPNWVTLNSAANNPLVLDYQDNGYTCGPTSLSMAIQCLYSWKSEKSCASACKTKIGSGTTPANLIAGAKSLGYQVTRIKRDYATVKANIDKGYPVIGHIQTAGSTKPACLGYMGNYGHYILIYGASSEKYFIADPTKGIKKCISSAIDKATNGRDIGYYSVKPL